MLKIIVGLCIAGWVVSSILHTSEEDRAQQARNTAQADILVAMDGQHDAGVSKLVEEWRDAHEQPADGDLVELRLLAERVKADPASASRYTAEAKQAKLDSLGVEPLFGWGTQKPGLDGAVPAPAAAPASVVTAGR